MKNIFIRVLVFCLFVGFIYYPITLFDKNQETNVEYIDSCMSSSFGFSYQLKGPLEENVSIVSQLPDESWNIRGKLPDFPYDSLEFSRRDWLLAVFFPDSENEEVWVLRSWKNNILESKYNSIVLLVYEKKTNKWSEVPIESTDQNIIIGEIFSSTNGEIWGRNYPNGDIIEYTPPYDVRISSHGNIDIPLFSRFDRDKGKFDVVEKSNIFLSGNNGDGYTKVIHDSEGNFWILMQQDGLYQYSPLINELTKVVDLQKYIKYTEITDIMINSDNKIVLSDSISTVIVYDSVDGSIRQINGINSLYDDSRFTGIVIDENDKLWFGNLGWAEGETYNVKYGLYPSPIFITRSEGNTLYAKEKPRLLLGSDDSRLWYLFSNGLVWMDTVDQKWCWYTSYQSNIVKDSDQNLWLIADGNLYKNEIDR